MYFSEYHSFLLINRYTFWCELLQYDWFEIDLDLTDDVVDGYVLVINYEVEHGRMALVGEGKLLVEDGHVACFIQGFASLLVGA